MKIIELQAENVKRLKAVDITPDGTLQVIGGRNAQGKSSVLDAETLEALRAQVAENDFQLWLEVVTTSTEGGAVIIDDGEVAE